MIELAQCEQTILHEIADPRMKRRDVAKTYALAVKSSECGTIDWGRVNQAIIDRWSPYALEFIKGLAWSGRAFDEGRRLSLRTLSACGRRRTDCTVTESCGNVFEDIGLPDPDRMLEDAERTFARDPKARRIDRRIDRISRA